jgi:predicted nuclease of predicted toxin-antitoxin system
MKFLVDECVGNGVAEWLKNIGYDTVSILEISPGASDNVLQRAVIEERILITLDKDFGDMVFRNRKEHCGIILLRLPNWQLAHKITALDTLLKNHKSMLQGNFVVFSDQSIRIIRTTPPS